MRHCATNQKVAGSSPEKVIDFFNITDILSLIMAVRCTQKLVLDDLSWAKARPARKVANFTAIFEAIV